MLSDGVADVNDDGWLMALLEKFQGDDPQALASAILAAGRERRGGDDDCAVLALYRDKDGGAVEVYAGPRGGILSLSKLCGQGVMRHGQGYVPTGDRCGITGYHFV